MAQRFHLVRPGDEAHTYCGRRVSLPLFIVRNPDDATCGTCINVRARATSGLQPSALGGLHPELRARIAAADAALGDFFREHEERRQTGAAVDYVSWAGRLAGELRGLLETIGRLS